ncbi:hypothetical protein FNV43_RR14919 [Rhamnella rubrinervis]|uniref:Bet v I/Major latex protein domain-containing protein n=1 Tax=Rhamnella rubrinervis TaxID=2594499 RepID=A0A8K0H0S3_9ROSA|nr:hypothetical protein FNV43_RR13285 [Rhamnella rubrinervis]KAF3445225.1 hypothetical protein FNV43_RR14919 [Rhamnella rubrinervis]
MAQIGKLEAQTEIKSSADKFYGFFKNNIKRLVEMFPQNLKSCEVLGGGGELRTGTVMSWKYDLGTRLEAKVKVQALDEENKSFTFVVTEGDVLKLYNSFKAKLEVSGGLVKWSLEFDKANQNAPNPDPHLDLAIKVSKGLDDYLYNN